MKNPFFVYLLTILETALYNKENIERIPKIMSDSTGISNKYDPQYMNQEYTGKKVPGYELVKTLPSANGDVNLYHIDFDKVEYCTDFFASILTPRIHHSDTGLDMPYRLWIPEHYDPNKKYPLAFYLHGSGLCGDDNIKQISGDFPADIMLLEHQQKEEFIFFVPQCSMTGPWSFYTEENIKPGINDYDAEHETDKSHAVIGIIRELVEEFSVDTSRIVVTGASMGGTGAYDLIVRYPELFSAAVIGAAISCAPTQAEAMTKTPIYLWHGVQDQAISVEGARISVKAIREKGGLVHYLERPDKGHAFLEPEVHDEMIAWALAQRKPNSFFE